MEAVDLGKNLGACFVCILKAFRENLIVWSWLWDEVFVDALVFKRGWSLYFTHINVGNSLLR